ncbi:hypothetical protein CEE44_02290 [Candidatus Woesearchaeota archaeon B3_Woes]|nr:MAG: hypothetical protein CEE44_02290 [Candidatus Woesearchaeota archaeon B3_Woes]
MKVCLMAVEHPWWKKAMCYVFCEWFTKPLFGKRLCVCAYDVLHIKKKVKRSLNGKDGGFKFLRAPKLIVLIGLDGSGKSTHAKNIIKFLNKNNFKTKYLHLPSVVPLNIIVKERESHKSNNKNNSKKSLLISFLRQIAFVIGIYYIIFFKIIPNILLGRIIVSDRWFYDELVHLKYINMCTFPRLYKFLIPHPSLLISLSINPKTAMKRKPDEEEKYYIKKNDLYNSLLKNLKYENILSNEVNATKKNIEKRLKEKLKYTLC